jgi:hypothetical protein
VRWLLRHHAADLRGREAARPGSTLEWTVARPPRLVEDADPTSRRIAGALPEGASVCSHRAVAAFLLDAISEGSHLREVVGIAR